MAQPLASDKSRAKQPKVATHLGVPWHLVGAGGLVRFVCARGSGRQSGCTTCRGLPDLGRGAPRVVAFPASVVVVLTKVGGVECCRREDPRQSARVALPRGFLGIGSVALGPRLAEASGPEIVARPAAEPPIAMRDVDAEASDSRTIPVRFDAQGERRRGFAEAVAEMSVEDLPGGFPL